MRNVERAKKIAERKGINISFVCREIGKSRGYISQMLTTDRDFPGELLTPVANALGVPVEELTGESGQKEEPAPGEGSGLDARFDALLSQMTDADRADLLEYMEFKVAKRKENPNG